MIYKTNRINKKVIHMIVLMVVLFVLGYAAIAMEHKIKINKAASALILSALLWVIYMFAAPHLISLSPDFREMYASQLRNGGDVTSLVYDYVSGVQMIESVGDIAEILFFLMGAMTIVELIDAHGGFTIVTDRIRTRNKRKLLWVIAGLTFLMSAVLDNLTTAIVMVMLVRKMVPDKGERWLFASVVVIAANSGGAFSPIGDVTTIMLWVKGNVTAVHLVPYLIFPSFISLVIPLLFICRMLKGKLPDTAEVGASSYLAEGVVSKVEQKTIFFLGIGSLMFVPVFKTLTHLPPFVGVLLGLSVLWFYTEIVYRRKRQVPESEKVRISVVLGRIDFSTILFFLGILLSVSALQCAGILSSLAQSLEQVFHGNVYGINIIIGMLSSVVDNVPLVAGAMGMYELAPVGSPEALAPFMQDGSFWLFLSYCAGVGGSMLIIGSAAGVVVMGLEGVDFGWYLKRISWLALLGYLSGAAVFMMIEHFV